MDRLDFIAYGVPLIIASVGGAGIGVYVINVMDDFARGFPIFAFFGILSLLLVFVFIIPPLKSYLEEYAESSKNILDEE